MADRTVRVRLEAAVAGFTASMQQAKSSVSGLGSEVTKTFRQNREEMQTVGTAMAVTGGLIVGAFGASAKAAIDFESSFAGVRKTVDASEAEFAALSDGFRSMAREIPVTVDELNGIGEAAGQLGIAKENILDFSRTMADLGVATNLTSEQAATAFARFANITQMDQGNFDRLGSTVVDLGNNLATTESEISEFGLRLAGAGAQIGLTEAEILGLGGALSSVGINAEAGGTAISKVMINMAQSVSEGGEELSNFASVAGMSADQFATAFREDPAAALAAFIEGLGQVDAAGGDLFATLEELGITEQRMRDAMLRTAGAGTLVADAMGLANDAWDENTALTDEAAQRYETLDSKIRIARNAVNDAAITVGQALTPALGFAADAATGLAGGIADLPGPAAGVIAGVGGLGGAAMLAAGGFLLAAPRILATKDALATLVTAMPRTVGAVRGLGTLLMGPVGIALGAATVGLALWAKEAGEARARADEFRATLDETTGALTESSRAFVANEFATVRDRVDDLGLSMEDLADASLGVVDADARVRAELDAVTQAAADYRAENGVSSLALDAKAAAAGVVRRKLDELTGTQEDMTAAARADAEVQAEAEGRYLDIAHAIDSGLTPAEASLRIEQQALNDTTAEGTGIQDEFGNELSEVESEAQSAADALQTYIDTQRAAVDPVFALTNALAGVEDAQQDYNEAVKEHGASSDEARDAAFGHAEALADLESAALNGDLAFGAFEGKLDEWVRQGRLTAEQADIIAERVGEARGEAEEYEGRYEAEMALARWKETGDGINDLRGRANALEDDGPYTAETDAETAEAMRRLAVLDAEVARVTRTRRLEIYVAQTGASLAGIGGRRGGYTQHEGGMAGSGPWRRYHSGGGVSPYGMLSANEVPLIAERGEFITRKEQTAKNLPLLQAINAGQPLAGAAGGNDYSTSRTVSVGQIVVQGDVKDAGPEVRHQLDLVAAGLT